LNLSLRDWQTVYGSLLGIAISNNQHSASLFTHSMDLLP
jgi:hypothetical protein